MDVECNMLQPWMQRHANAKQSQLLDDHHAPWGDKSQSANAPNLNTHNLEFLPFLAQCLVPEGHRRATDTSF